MNLNLVKWFQESEKRVPKPKGALESESHDDRSKLAKLDVKYTLSSKTLMVLAVVTILALVLKYYFAAFLIVSSTLLIRSIFNVSKSKYVFTALLLFLTLGTWGTLLVALPFLLKTRHELMAIFAYVFSNFINIFIIFGVSSSLNEFLGFGDITPQTGMEPLMQSYSIFGIIGSILVVIYTMKSSSRLAREELLNAKGFNPSDGAFYDKKGHLSRKLRNYTNS